MAAAAEPGAGENAGARLRWLSIVAFFVLWQAAATIIASRLLPTPTAVALTILDYLRDGSLPFHVGMTLARVAVAFVVAMLVGALVGILMGWSRHLDLLLDSWLIIGLNVPALVLIILCYVWMGLNDAALVTAVALNKIPVVAVTLREGARAVQPELLEVARAFRVPRGRTLARVYLPQLYPYAMAATRSGLALIWKIVLVVELLGRSNGVGFQLGVYFQFFDIRSIFAYTFAFIFVIMSIEIVMLRPVERRLTGWRL